MGLVTNLMRLFVPPTCKIIWPTCIGRFHLCSNNFHPSAPFLGDAKHQSTAFKVVAFPCSQPPCDTRCQETAQQMYRLPPEVLEAHAAKLAEESALEALSVGKLWMWSRRIFLNGILGDFHWFSKNFVWFLSTEFCLFLLPQKIREGDFVWRFWLRCFSWVLKPSSWNGISGDRWG